MSATLVMVWGFLGRLVRDVLDYLKSGRLPAASHVELLSMAKRYAAWSEASI
jgi:hypothetical protein